MTKHPIEDPLASYIDAASEGITTAYVVVATVETVHGEQSFWVTTLKGQTASVTLGLLESCAAAEKYRIAKSFEHLDDDD